MFKPLIFIIMVLLSIHSYSQSVQKEQDSKVVIYEIEINVDSAEEIEKAITTKDIDFLFSSTEPNEEIIFRLQCKISENHDKIKSNMTYTVSGNTNDKEQFIKNLEKAKSSALKFYNSKNKD
ncbi:hypothetical protein DFQ11_10451 [Winogradskyella epiphytica]|uniref:Uncharacterized protein n=1 Tax=Winogradskyella epiphytica TaxID=262005 RepID=A0A2V4XDL1_9FLAO|nr:hypothetical protein [Winogradskyella epiphytica]PYE80685.1 hypothetical protein DFQ11_10451 [Winogradskyella epiphytica]GGW67716.1 hypothetical protein GCM10008085_19470 [Winogradskyella epiphytica]